MNILFTSDAATYPGLEVAIYSLLTHNKNVNIYIFTMDVEVPYPDNSIRKYCGLDTWQKNKLKKIVEILDKNSNICFIDVLKYYDTYLRGGPNYYSCFTPYATLRLVTELVLPNIDNILYLDCDVSIHGDISGIYNSYSAHNSNYSAYYCNDACEGEGEMVSGVVLFNLKKIRETGFLETARRNYLANEYRYPDQMAMRDADTADRLPEDFGWCYDLAKLDYMPSILHYTNQLSPKAYSKEYTREYFYRKFPFLKYIKDGAELLDKIFKFD